MVGILDPGILDPMILTFKNSGLPPPNLLSLILNKLQQLYFLVYLKVYASISIFVENPKYLINKHFCIPRRQDHGVHL